MKKEVKDKWLEALRSGEYKQCRGTMIMSKDGSFSRATEFCCLGVGCVVVAKIYGINVDTVTNKYGDGIRPMGITFNQGQTLIDMNDKQMKSFPEIADWIEQNIKAED